MIAPGCVDFEARRLALGAHDVDRGAGVPCRGHVAGDQRHDDGPDPSPIVLSIGPMASDADAGASRRRCRPIRPRAGRRSSGRRAVGWRPDAAPSRRWSVASASLSFLRRGASSPRLPMGRARARRVISRRLWLLRRLISAKSAARLSSSAAISTATVSSRRPMAACMAATARGHGARCRLRRRRRRAGRQVAAEVDFRRVARCGRQFRRVFTRHGSPSAS